LGICISITAIGDFLLGSGIIITAISDLSRGPEDPDGRNAVVVVSFFSMLFFGILSIFKFQYASKIDSPSLRKDGICSLMGTILSGALCLNTLIIEQVVPSAWWIYPAVAFTCGIGSIITGFVAVYAARYRENLPVFTVSWWMLSQGDGTEEGSGRPLRPKDFGNNCNNNESVFEIPRGDDKDEDDNDIV
jgi:hypothetical protein